MNRNARPARRSAMTVPVPVRVRAFSLLPGTSMTAGLATSPSGPLVCLYGHRTEGTRRPVDAVQCFDVAIALDPDLADKLADELRICAAKARG